MSGRWTQQHWVW